MKNLNVIGFIAIALIVAYFVASDMKSEQTADLGQVLDRVEFSLSNYQSYLDENSITEVGEDQFGEFTEFVTLVLNSAPRFYDKTLGLTVMGDASFLGFADANANGVQDDKEGKVFTVEIDEANNRLIATDVAGNSTGLRFSGSGFLAGALIGSLIGRQRGAGITSSSFSNRKITPRGSYSAPRSARSGGLRSGK